MEDVASARISMTRKCMLMTLCLTALVLSRAQALAAADAPGVRPKVAVVNAVELPERMESTQARLRDLLEDAVRKRGFDIIRPAQAPSCTDASCLPDFAKANGVTDVLIARGGRSGAYGYHIELSLWNAATGEVVPAIADCAVCSGPQMTDSVAQAAGPLLDRVGIRPPPKAVPPAPPALSVRPVASPPVVESPANPASSDTIQPSSGRRILGWSLVAVGAGAAVTGGILWSFNGKGTDCVGSSCKSTYRTEGEGIAFLAGGLVAAGVGVWLVLESPHRDLSMTLGPSSVALTGAF